MQTAIESTPAPEKQMIPNNILSLLEAISVIRKTILVEDPQLLPRLAPAIKTVESGIDSYWQSLV